VLSIFTFTTIRRWPRKLGGKRGDYLSHHSIYLIHIEKKGKKKGRSLPEEKGKKEGASKSA